MLVAAGPPLLANKFDLLVFVIIIVIAIFRALFSAVRESGQKPQRPRPRTRGEVELQREIERFLGKKAGGGRAAEQRRPMERSAEVFEATVAEPPPRRRPPQQRRRRPLSASAERTMRRRPGEDLEHRHLRPAATGADVRSHVEQHILGEIKQFERQVESEAAPTVPEAVAADIGPSSRTAPPPPARRSLQDVLPILTAPDGWRQIVIGAELLNRPKALRRR